jgi:Fungal specific transcription factor domain
LTNTQTFLFQQNLYRDAVSLLGIVARLAQTMGHHRDPSHFSFTLWVCEIRRRIFNHLSCLDALILNNFGAESCLPQTSDSQPPRNANDREWHASRFAKASDIPPNAVGFKDMTYVLAQREIADLIRQLSRLNDNDFQSQESLIRRTEMSLNERYLRQIDRSNPLQTVVAAMAEVNLSSLRLRIRYRQSKGQQSDQTKSSDRS